MALSFPYSVSLHWPFRITLEFVFLAMTSLDCRLYQNQTLFFPKPVLTRSCSLSAEIGPRTPPWHLPTSHQPCSWLSGHLPPLVQASTRSHRLESSLLCVLCFTLAFPDCFPCYTHEQPFKCKPNLSFLPPEKRKNSIKSQSFLRFSLKYRPTEFVAFPQQSWLAGPPLPLESVLARPSP